MKAYNVKYGAKVKVIDDNIEIPPASIPVNKGDEIKILRVDGMYCKGINKDNDKVFIAAWTEVEQIQ
ncbi:MAG: hypothetical protein U9R54_08160 [Bacteroidota bacterium]|nr:hypothetical protein [Bacteroidota bacterium]